MIESANCKVIKNIDRKALCQERREIMIVYKITNFINGKIYIGQTTRTIEKRFEELYGGKLLCLKKN